MQNDLISRSALREKLINLEPAGYAQSFAGQAMLSELAAAPAIDAVPVVRCRECEYAEKTVWSSGEMYCRIWKMNPTPDGYCHCGAKRDTKSMNALTENKT